MNGHRFQALEPRAQCVDMPQDAVWLIPAGGPWNRAAVDGSLGPDAFVSEQLQPECDL